MKKYLIVILLFNSVLGLFAQIETKESSDSTIQIEAASNNLIAKFDSLPVLLKNNTVFFIKGTKGIGQLTERSKKIEQQITTIFTSYDELRDTIKSIAKDENTLLITYNDELIFTVNSEDAILEHKYLKDLAKERIRALKIALYHKKYNLSSTEWLKRIAFTVLTFIGLFIIIFLINFIFKHINKRLSKYDKKLLKRRNSIIKYLIPKNTKNIFVFISSSVRTLLLIILLFTYLPLLFSFIPWTQGWVHLFYSYIEQPVFYVINGFIDFLPDLFFIIVIFYIIRYFTRVSTDIFDDIEHENIKFANFPKDLASPTKNMVNVIIYVFGLVMIFPHLPGSNSPAFKGISLFLGVLFSLGSTSAVSNVVAGIVITYMRPFKIGDRIEINGIVGDVIDKTMLVTRMRTSKNEEVTIPNANVINSHLVNYTANASEDGLILHTTITLGYDLAWEEANKLLVRAARKTHLIQKTPKPFVLQTSLDDNYVTYELNVYTKQANKMAAIYSELNTNLLDVFNEAGVEIVSPKYVASRDGNASTVPSQKGVDIRNPVAKVVDHLTGKNQEITVKKNPKE